MPRERNSVKIDLAMTTNDNVQDYIVRMLRNKLNDMQFEREYYKSELDIANDQKRVNLSNGRKYAELYIDKLACLDREIKVFEETINIINKTVFPKLEKEGNYVK
jgi:hypothetical protein